MLGPSEVLGSERADVLANERVAVETLRPDPVLAASLRLLIKTKIREWAHLQFHNQWLNSALAQSTKEVLKYTNIKTLPFLKDLRKPIIALTTCM